MSNSSLERFRRSPVILCVVYRRAYARMAMWPGAQALRALENFKIRSLGSTAVGLGSPVPHPPRTPAFDAAVRYSPSSKRKQVCFLVQTPRVFSKNETYHSNANANAVLQWSPFVAPICLQWGETSSGTVRFLAPHGGALCNITHRSQRPLPFHSKPSLSQCHQILTTAGQDATLSASLGGSSSCLSNRRTSQS